MDGPSDSQQYVEGPNGWQNHINGWDKGQAAPHHLNHSPGGGGGGGSALLEKLRFSGCHLLVLSLVATKAKLYIFDHVPLFDETFCPIKLCNTPISPKTVQTVHVVDGDWFFFSSKPEIISVTSQRPKKRRLKNMES